jgi:hypothetical protein
MATPPCDCDSECPGCTSCAVVYELPHGRCWRFCDGCPNPIAPGLKVRDARSPVTRDALVDFHMRNSSLAEAAQLLFSAAYREIFVPASRINERRDLHLESVPLDTVLRELGLTAQEPAT